MEAGYNRLDYSEVVKTIVNDISEVISKDLVVEFGVYKHIQLAEICFSGKKSHMSGDFYNNFVNDFVFSNARNRIYKKYARNRFLLLVNYAMRVLKLSCDRFADLDPASITSLYMLRGDTHHDAASTCQIISEDRNLYYKPRGYSAECLYRSIYRLLDSHYQHHSIYNGNNDDYWSEECRYNPIVDLPSYYYQYGFVCALMACLGATDIHFGNVICSGGRPIVIDTETFMSPRTFGYDGLSSSLKTTGLIPACGYYDLSPLGVSSKSNYPIRMRGIVEANTDNMHAVMQERIIDVSKIFCRPEAIDPKIPFGNNLPDMYSGFIECINSIAINRGRLQDLIISSSNCHIRVVVRPTFEYKLVLIDGITICNPVHKLSELRYFDMDAASSIKAAEKLALMRGDIPLFNSDIHKYKLTSEGFVVLEGALRSPASFALDAIRQTKIITYGDFCDILLS